MRLLLFFLVNREYIHIVCLHANRFHCIEILVEHLIQRIHRSFIFFFDSTVKHEFIFIKTNPLPIYSIVDKRYTHL